MSKPLVSVIVSCYKGGKVLPVCLDALLSQSLQDIEIICINDGSPDNTAKVLSSYAKKDSRIVAISNKKNIGVSASRNKGIELAKSEYIMFCDCDDYYEPEACEHMLDAIKKSNADIAINGIHVIYEAHEEMRFSDSNYYSLKYSGLQTINDELILNTDLSPTNKIFRKQLLDKFSIRFPEGLYYEDAFFCSAYFCCCDTAFYLDEQLYNYIRHQKSTMSNTWSSNKEKDPAIDHLYIAFRLFDFLSKNKLLEKHNKLYWQLFLAFEYFSLSNSKTRARRKQIRSEAKAFIAKNQDSFNRADDDNRKEILLANSSSLKLAKVKTKKMLIRFMPTYKFQTFNLQRLKRLKNTNSQLSRRIEEIKSKI